tara:strand:+ start:3014 stop:4618 length:1605 start_codon:yes stop_codon:yes gene_type:complete
MPTDCISLRDTAFASKLICDYVENNPGLHPFYTRFPKQENFKSQLEAKQTQFSTEKRTVLVKALTRQYAEELGPSAQTTKTIESLLSPNTFTITTGHQLNLMGGPLYFLYKIISTINLAKQLKKNQPEYNFVPVFWMATEDHDFEEINHFNFKNKRFQWTKNSSGAVGELSTSDLTEFVTIFTNALGNTIHANRLKELMQNAYLKHSNLAASTRSLVHALFAEEGLLVIDGNDQDLKRLFIPLITSELTTQNAYRFISETTQKLKVVDAAYKVQVNPREINLFYIRTNFRERIVLKEGVYSVLNSDFTWTLEEVLSELESNPERFSPNVIMRPIYQETILPNLCYVGGGGELSYWLQLKSYFESENVVYPILLHRNSVLLVSEKQQQKLDKLKVSIADLFQNKQQLISVQIKNTSKLSIDFSNQKEFLKQQFTAIYELAHQTDKSFIGAVAAQEKKQTKGLDALEKRLLKAEKKAHKNYIKRLETIYLELFPNNNLQERYSNFSQFYLGHGDDFIERLKSELLPLNQNFQIFYL